MKTIKTYRQFINESHSSDDLVNFYETLKNKYSDLEFHSVEHYDSNGHEISFSFEYCPIEPETGSYTHRWDANINIEKEGDAYLLKLHVLAGEYGCDEDDEDSDFEPEFDYQIGHSDFDLDENGLTLDEVKNKIDEIIKDNCGISITEKKKNPEAAVRNRGDVVFPSGSSKVTDDKDHFPINTASQARNALARVNQYDSVPNWFDGSLEELVKHVQNKVKRTYPEIKVTEKSGRPGKG